MATRELARVAETVTENLRFHEEATTPFPLHLSEVVDAAINVYRARLAAAEIWIDRDFRECPPIFGVAGELRQLILNLIANALDAIGRGGILRIRIASAHQHHDGSRPGVRLTIGDTGSGIHPSIRNSLFEPFAGTRDTRTGLGLWVSSEIVRRHGGTIQVKSRAQPPSTGTVFSVFLPSQPDWNQGRYSAAGRDHQRERVRLLTSSLVLEPIASPLRPTDAGLLRGTQSLTCTGEAPYARRKPD